MNSRGFGDGKTVTGVYAGFSPALKGNEEIEGKGFYPAGDPEACSAAAFAKRPRKQPWVAVGRARLWLFSPGRDRGGFGSFGG